MNLRPLVAAPWLHFVLLGAALFLLDPTGRRRAGARAPDRAREIEITPADRRLLAEGWAREWGREPSLAEERALVAAAVEEEVLLREAFARGLDRDDRLIRTRLAGLARFLGETGDDDALVRAARRLGLDRTDPIVHRYLVQGMRLLAAQPAASDVPTEADVAAYVARHPELGAPERFRLTHVFVSGDRGAAARPRAEELLRELRATGAGPEAAAGRGDPFVRGNEIGANGRADLARAFGPAFADAVTALPIRTWSGPIASSYGLHLVWLDTRTPSAAPALAAVRNQVIHHLLKERRAARARERIAEWTARYEVRIAAEPPVGRAAAPSPRPPAPPRKGDPSGATARSRRSGDQGAAGDYAARMPLAPAGGVHPGTSR